MQSTILKGADLSGANLEGANLEEANLQRANLSGALGLDIEQLRQARNWVLASYDSSSLAQLRLSADHNQKITSKDLSHFDFRASNLMNADLTGMDLSNSNLAGTNLRNANISNADLAGANFLDADLQRADLSAAKNLVPHELRKARNWPLAFYGELSTQLELPKNHDQQIRYYSLFHAQLAKANLRGARLSAFDLKRAVLREALLHDAVFHNADVQETDLRDTQGLLSEQIKKAKNWPLALYSSGLLEQLGLPADHNDRIGRKDLSGIELDDGSLRSSDLESFNFAGTNLQGADLTGSRLKNANLRHAKLQKAILEGVDLEGADFEGADLSGTHFSVVRNLTADQLQKAKNWILAFFDESILDELKLGIEDLTVRRVNEKDFHGLHLSNVNLALADLPKANFTDADLTGTDLRGCTLARATFTNAIMSETKLRDTNLQDANLETVTGLLGGQLGGANVSGAKLPADIKEFKGLANIDESSKNASSLFIAIIGSCLYSVLTVASTTDAALLTNSASSPLPVIQTAIPIVGFYVVAPLLMVALYIYFHLSLQRLWEQLAEQPAIFPDGKPLDKRAYPWLLNGLVHSYFRQLSQNRPSLSRLQAHISFWIAWWMVPATLVLFWVRYLPRQEWKGTLLHIVLLAGIAASAVFFHQLTAKTLKGEAIDPFSLRALLKVRTASAKVFPFLLIALILFVISLQIMAKPSFATCSASPEGFVETVRNVQLNWLQRIYALIRSPFAQLSETNVSTKPANWSGKSNDDIGLVSGATLKSRSLRYAEATRAFMINADLRGADLEGADLADADLRGANLSQAYLANSCLVNSDLSGANLQNTYLTGAKLARANLLGANLEGDQIEKAQLQSARNWIFAFYTPEVLKDLNLPAEHNRRIRTKNLSGYDLQRAELAESKLSDFNLSGVNFSNANLVNADLRASNLKQSSLKGANLAGANFEKASLVGANLENADLTGDHMQGTDLTGVIGLNEIQLRTMFTDATTRLPTAKNADGVGNSRPTTP